MRIAWLGAAIVVATVAIGTILDAHGVVLGVPTPPFLAPIDFRAHPLALVAAVVLAAAVALAPRALTLGPGTFAVMTLLATLVVRLAVNAGRYGTDEWDRVFAYDESFEAKNEYLPALPALRYGAQFALDRWAELIPSLPPHAAAHPPGTLLTLDALAITTAGGMAALCIGAGVLATPLAYATARHLLTERRARLATLLLVLSPDALLMGATSADALFLALGMLAAWPLAAFATGAARLPLAVGAVAAAVGSMFAWSLPAVAAWAAVIAWRRGGLRRAGELSAACVLAAAALYAGLYAAAGYDVLGALAATEDIYRFSVASTRPYAFWLFGSPVAWAVVLGVPIAWYALRARSDVALAIGLVIGAAAVLGFTKAETERIWLFLVPLACFAAAQVLPPRRLRTVLALLAAQALAIELAFQTVW